MARPPHQAPRHQDAEPAEGHHGEHRRADGDDVGGNAHQIAGQQVVDRRPTGDEYDAGAGTAEDQRPITHISEHFLIVNQGGNDLTQPVQRRDQGIAQAAGNGEGG